jgi:hypothetical protein
MRAYLVDILAVGFFMIVTWRRQFASNAWRAVESWF